MLSQHEKSKSLKMCKMDLFDEKRENKTCNKLWSEDFFLAPKKISQVITRVEMSPLFLVSQLFTVSNCFLLFWVCPPQKNRCLVFFKKKINWSNSDFFGSLNTNLEKAETLGCGVGFTGGVLSVGVFPKIGLGW